MNERKSAKSRTGRDWPLSPQAAEAFPGLVVLLDQQARLVLANRAAQALFARPRQGAPLELFARFPAMHEAATFLAQGGDKGKFTLYLPVPVARHFTIHARRLGDYFLLFLEETTPLLQSRQMRSEFIADISHELKTPLAVLISGLEELALEGNARARREVSALLRRQAQRMAGLVDRLISLARIEAHEHNPPQGKVDLSELAREAGATFAARAKAQGAQIRLQVEENLPPVIGDSDELAQLLLNLVDNALTHGGGKSGKIGAVEIILQKKPGAVRLAVRDDGKGIAAEHVPRLTERFFRVPGAAGGKGAGLGLAIAKHILARHRAHLAVASAPGKGALFETLLPAAGQHAQSR